MRATKEVENSISRIAISPSLFSKHFEKGSVVYIRKPLEVPFMTALAYCHTVDHRLQTNSEMAVVLVECHKVHRHFSPRCIFLPIV